MKQSMFVGLASVVQKKPAFLLFLTQKGTRLCCFPPQTVTSLVGTIQEVKHLPLLFFSNPQNHKRKGQAYLLCQCPSMFILSLWQWQKSKIDTFVSWINIMDALSFYFIVPVTKIFFIQKKLLLYLYFAIKKWLKFAWYHRKSLRGIQTRHFLWFFFLITAFSMILE